MHSNRQNSHIFAVVLNKDTPEARAVRGTPGDIYYQLGLKQYMYADGSTASKQEMAWDRSFSRGKQASSDEQGSGKIMVLLMSLVGLSLVALRFARLVVRQCRRALVSAKSNA